MQLASLYGQGGGRIPLADGSSITVMLTLIVPAITSLGDALQAGMARL